MAKIPVVTVGLRCQSCAYSRYAMAGAALVHSVCATTATETHRLAPPPRTTGLPATPPAPPSPKHLCRGRTLFHRHDPKTPASVPNLKSAISGGAQFRATRYLFSV